MKKMLNLNVSLLQKKIVIKIFFSFQVDVKTILEDHWNMSSFLYMGGHIYKSHIILWEVPCC